MSRAQTLIVASGSATPLNAGCIMAVMSSESVPIGGFRPVTSSKVSLDSSRLGAAGGASGTARSIVTTSSSDWRLRLPSASIASALSRWVPLPKFKLRVSLPVEMNGPSISVLPSMIMTLVPTSEVTRNGTLLAALVMLSVSEMPESEAAGRSMVGRRGCVVMSRLQPPSMLPMSRASSSNTYKFHVPLASSPLSAESVVPYGPAGAAPGNTPTPYWVGLKVPDTI